MGEDLLSLVSLIFQVSLLLQVWVFSQAQGTTGKGIGLESGVFEADKMAEWDVSVGVVEDWEKDAVVAESELAGSVAEKIEEEPEEEPEEESEEESDGGAEVIVLEQGTDRRTGRVAEVGVDMFDPGYRRIDRSFGAATGDKTENRKT